MWKTVSIETLCYLLGSFYLLMRSVSEHSESTDVTLHCWLYNPISLNHPGYRYQLRPIKMYNFLQNGDSSALYPVLPGFVASATLLDVYFSGGPWDAGLVRKFNRTNTGQPAASVMLGLDAAQKYNWQKMRAWDDNSPSFGVSTSVSSVGVRVLPPPNMALVAGAAGAAAVVAMSLSEWDPP